MTTYHDCDNHCKTMASLHIIRDTADYYARKYRFDPLIGDLHKQYVDAISSVIEADNNLRGINV